jgi:hypothetical protein
MLTKKGLLAFVTSYQFHALHDQFFIIRSHFYMTSEQFEKGDNQNWLQNTNWSGWSWPAPDQPIGSL